MHAEATTSRHVVVHDAENTFLHLACVRGSQDDELLRCEIHIDRSLVTDVLDVFVGHELTSVHDGEIWASVCEVSLDVRQLSANEHLLHKEGVVRSGRDDSSLDSVLLVPACVSINDEEL